MPAAHLAAAPATTADLTADLAEPAGFCFTPDGGEAGWGAFCFAPDDPAGRDENPVNLCFAPDEPSESRAVAGVGYVPLSG
jgi:hypothetical protein